MKWLRRIVDKLRIHALCKTTERRLTGELGLARQRIAYLQNFIKIQAQIIDSDKRTIKELTGRGVVQ